MLIEMGAKGVEMVVDTNLGNNVTKMVTNSAL